MGLKRPNTEKSVPPPLPQSARPHEDIYKKIFGDPDSTNAHAVPNWEESEGSPRPPKKPVQSPAEGREEDQMPMVAEPAPKGGATDIFGSLDSSGAQLPPRFETTTGERQKSVPPKPKSAPKDSTGEIAMDDLWNAPAGSSGGDHGAADIFGAPESAVGGMAPIWDTPAGEKPKKPKAAPKAQEEEIAPLDFGLDSRTPQPPFQAKGDLSNIFGSPEGTSAQAPPDWSNVKTGWENAPQPTPITTPPPSAKRTVGQTPPPTPRPGVQPSPMAFPTPPPWSGGAAPASDHFVTPPPLQREMPPDDIFPPAPPPLSFASAPPPPISEVPPAPPKKDESKTGDPWGAFFSEQKAWREEDKSRRETMSKSLGERPKEPMMRPLMPIPVSPEQSDRMADEDAVTVRRPPGERIVSAPPPPPPSPPPMAQEEVLFAGSNKDQTMVWSRHFVKDRELSLNPDHRYSVIIAPAATVQAREVIEVMRKYLGLNDSGVVYAIKRRHGILASDLTLNESVELAKEFNENGQSVCVIEQDDRLAFGEPSDVMRIKFEEKTAKFYTLDKAVSRKYKDMVGIGCGSAAAQAGSPERDVLDLFFAEPGLHLRIWRNTLMSAPPAFTGKVENVGEFHLLAKHLIKLAPDAIQTQSFIQWVGGTDPKIPVQFSSLIEYDNYTRWYLMAHYGRSKPFEPVLRKR